VGDIHGQFYDFVKLIEPDIGGDPEENKYVFLGDYVDRGSFSIEVLTLLLSMKITHPKTVVMLRGNHECRQLTSFFNFRVECTQKFMQALKNMISKLMRS
jgi:serine/threonine-protein phosphatase 2B catalytic subunit